MTRQEFKTLYGRARKAGTGYTTAARVYVNDHGAQRLTATGATIPSPVHGLLCAAFCRKAGLLTATRAHINRASAARCTS